MKQKKFRPIGLLIAGAGLLGFGAGLLKGIFSLLGNNLDLLPGNGWWYFFGGVVLFWIGAFIYSPLDQRKLDAEAIKKGKTPFDFMEEALEEDKTDE